MHGNGSYNTLKADLENQIADLENWIAAETLIDDSKTVLLFIRQYLTISQVKKPLTDLKKSIRNKFWIWYYNRIRGHTFWFLTLKNKSRHVIWKLWLEHWSTLASQDKASHNKLRRQTMKYNGDHWAQ